MFGVYAVLLWFEDRNQWNPGRINQRSGNDEQYAIAMRGDRVKVRSKAEVLKSVDKDGRLERTAIPAGVADSI